MAAVKEANIVRVAVTRQNFMSQFIKLDQKQPLAAIIESVCEGWNLGNPDNYALRLHEGQKTVVTERNRLEIKNGDILELFDSPMKAADNILEDLKSGSNEKQTESLKLLAELSEDSKFAGNFFNKNGLPVLLKIVESNTYNDDKLGYVLSAICDLMAHNLSSWDIFEDNIVKQVSANIAKPSGVNLRVLQSSLEILENIAINGTSNYAMVQKLVSPVTLLTHLNNSDQEVQKNTIALINALFIRADEETRKKYAESLQLKSFRNTVMQQVVRGKTLSDDTFFQLYVLQSLLFNFLQELRRTPVNVEDSHAAKDLNRLRRTAFETDGESTNNVKRKSHVADFRKLGFENVTEPLEDFTVVPPGALGLKTMVYFAKTHPEDYAKIVLENSCRTDNHDLPFAKACIALTELLCEILHVGQQPTDIRDGRFCPMFFTTDCPFEELFCICVNLLNKTWKEMRATLADFSKVMSVAKEQIYRALEDRHNSFDQFRVKLNKLTYAQITSIWQAERKDKEEWASQAKPIKELREQLKPEIYELIKQQRLNFLVEGSRFKLTSRRAKEKYWYCKLTPNHKALVYYECNENGDMTSDQTEKKLNVEDIKCLMTGKDCPHVNNKKRRENQGSSQPLAFSILTDKEIEVISEKEVKDPPSLNFIVDTEDELDKWVDGINALLQQTMTSKLQKEEMDILLSMEIKLRLLDTEGITIPESPPEIPTEPPSYDFHYDT